MDNELQIKENIKLAPYTTFKIGGEARWFCVVNDQFDALQAFEFARGNHLQTFILGGGSNILISDEGFDGLVIRVVNKGIEVLHTPPQSPPKLGGEEEGVLLKVASGEVWDEVVKFAVNNHWWGIENLSHIPGSTGAIAVQNVGAYGQEAKNLIESVTVFDTRTHQILNLAGKDCGFAYRSSIFNTTQRGKYIIFYITFRLSKIMKPLLGYRDLQNKFADKTPSLAEIRRAVIEIRDKKYPFPTEAKKGNAGSFFKNPVLDKSTFAALKNQITKKFGDAVAAELEKKKFFDETGSRVKVPAAFLLEICGLKHVQEGGAAINHNQPLVIINKTGQASAKDVLNLAEQVHLTVKGKLGIALQFEPELVGF